MSFHFSPKNRVVRLLASLVLMGMGAAVAEEFALLGLALMGLGFASACYQGVMLWRERRDRYDLSRLWDEPPAEPEADDRAERDMIYCHRCGASMSQVHSICPGCGAILG